MSIVRLGARPPPSFDDPVAVLDASHRRIEDSLATIERALAALPSAEALSALADIVRHFDAAVVRHTEDEEQSLFPRLERRPMLDELEAEHRATEAIYLAFRTVAARVGIEPALVEELRAHATALCAAYRAHMAREEASVFPEARALEPAELRAIGIEMRLRRGGGEI